MSKTASHAVILFARLFHFGRLDVESNGSTPRFELELKDAHREIEHAIEELAEEIVKETRPRRRRPA